MAQEQEKQFSYNHESGLWSIQLGELPVQLVISCVPEVGSKVDKTLAVGILRGVILEETGTKDSLVLRIRAGREEVHRIVIASHPANATNTPIYFPRSSGEAVLTQSEEPYQQVVEYLREHPLLTLVYTGHDGNAKRSVVYGVRSDEAQQRLNILRRDARPDTLSRLLAVPQAETDFILGPYEWDGGPDNPAATIYLSYFLGRRNSQTPTEFQSCMVVPKPARLQCQIREKTGDRSVKSQQIIPLVRSNRGIYTYQRSQPKRLIETS